MPFAAALDEIPKPVFILLMILGFMAWWPIGLALLAVMIGSRRMGCWHHHSCGEWAHPIGRWHAKMERMQGKMDRMRGGDWRRNPPSSGNRAFDDYRVETLRRLEDEQREFKEFLERLRFAKDRAEFDQFMSERRNRDDRSDRDGPPGDRPNDEGPQPQA